MRDCSADLYLIRTRAILYTVAICRNGHPLQLSWQLTIRMNGRQTVVRLEDLSRVIGGRMVRILGTGGGGFRLAVGQGIGPQDQVASRAKTAAADPRTGNTRKE
jgi:hypothetical protein